MAPDLIPPPSPAGRPDVDAPRFIELPPETASATDTGAPSPAPGPSPFRNRFGFVMGALGGIVVAALAALVIVIVSGGSSDDEGLAPNWSRWQPSSHDTEAGAAQIAEHVAPNYRREDGKQLVSVTGGPLAIQGVPLNVLLRPQGGDITPVKGTGVLYTLNGLGPHGSISSGKATLERGRLTRREALELALYSFRYLHGVDMVVALLPPPPPAKGETASATATPTQALFYRPGDLKPQLQVPLAATIAPAAARPSTIGGEEARRIDALTMGNRFVATAEQAQDTKAYLVLDRPSG